MLEPWVESQKLAVSAVGPGNGNGTGSGGDDGDAGGPAGGEGGGAEDALDPSLPASIQVGRFENTRGFREYKHTFCRS